MIALSLKNFLKNLKYFFTPLGTLFLGIVVGLSVLLPGLSSIITNLGDEAKELLNNTSLNFDALGNTIINEISKLNWASVDEALKTILNKEWLYQVIDKSLRALAGDYGAVSAEIQRLIVDTINSFTPLLVTFVFFSLCGLFGGYFLTRMLVRKEIASRSFKKFILATLVDAFLTMTLISFGLWLLTIWSPSIYITVIVSVLLFGMLSLLEAYLSQAKKNIKFEQIVNLKNSINLLISNIIICLIVLFLIVIISYFFNFILGFFIGISLLEIAFSIISLNAESYVKDLAK